MTEGLWYLGAAYLLLALIIACDGYEPPPPTFLAEASYDASTQTLTFTLSDGTTIAANLDQLVTRAALSAVLQALPQETQPDLRYLITEQEVRAAIEALSGLEPDISLAAPTAGQLLLALSDGTILRATLSELVTDDEVSAYMEGLTATFEARFQEAIRPTSTAIPLRPPTPRHTPTPQPPARQQATLDVGMAFWGPYAATNYDANYYSNRYAELVTHETLFVMGFDGEWGPRLVKSFDISPDALTHTLYLQEGARWHDVHGDWGEFTADDFIWSIGEIAREGSTHVQSRNTRKIFACDGCALTKIDDYTVELKRPSPTFQLTWFSQAPIPGFSMNSKKHFDAVGRQAALHQDVGTGAWEQVEYVTDVRRHVRAIKDHWRHTPEFDEMIWHDIPRESVRLANFLGRRAGYGHLQLGFPLERSKMRDLWLASRPDVKFADLPRCHHTYAVA